MATENERKLKIFREVAHALNESGITSILYGSLGLYKAVNEPKRKVNDVDILVSDEFTNGRWSELRKIMEELDFALSDEHEHEFIRNGEIVAFGKQSDLVELAKVNPEDIKLTKESGAEFRELSPEQYLRCYQFMLRDSYRQEKRGKNDQEKIALIENYLIRGNI